MHRQAEGRLPTNEQDPTNVSAEPQLAATRHIITDLRRKTRLQCEHIMQLQRALQQQQQQHRHDISMRSDQLAALANQLLLLESRLKRRQTQIAVVMRQREHTIVRQQKVIETLSNRLTDHGLGVSVLPDRTSAMPCNDSNPFANISIANGHAANTDLDSLNDSDSAVVLDDIDLDWASTASGLGMRRDSNGTAPPHVHGIGGGSDGVTIVRSISDAIDTNYKATYGGGKRGSCFLRRPEMLETVYSVEEDHEQAASAAVDSVGGARCEAASNTTAAAKRLAMRAGSLTGRCSRPAADAASDTVSIASAPSLTAICSSVSSAAASPERTANGNGSAASVVRTSHYNRVMSSNHRSVTKPKDVKYRRINKVKSKSLEELCGQLKQTDGSGGEGAGPAEGCVQQQQLQKQPHAQELMQKRSVGANNHT